MNNNAPYNHNALNVSQQQNYLEYLDNVYADVDKKYTDEYMETRGWVLSLPKKWRGADLSNNYKNPVHIRAVENICQNLRINLKDEKRKYAKRLKSFYLYSVEAGSGKTYFAYAIIKKYIESGLLRSDEVKIVSIDQLENYAKMGFVGAKNVDNLLNTKYKLFLIDSLEVPALAKNPNALNYLNILINFIYNNDLDVIVTSYQPIDSFSVLTKVTLAHLKELTGERGIISLSGGTKTQDGTKSRAGGKRRLVDNIDGLFGEK